MLHIMKRKGVYPYEYVETPDILKQDHILQKSDFYSSLNDSCISDKDYVRYMQTWRKLGCKSLKNYHNIYLNADVTLLTDVFEEFRRVSLKSYGLDPCWYFTAPSLSWDAMLKMTKVKLELLKDPTMYMFFESPDSKRGGISSIMHRHAKANNSYLPNYDPTKPSSHII